ncbi:MAG: methylated-DNA--[protein]-cysteine S-methyltransferase [Pseudomonadota bacterium]|nr:methylated-DNA--[protein]-cysteine S-methyltransferase [Pseudomonadota bacterium]
MPVRAMLTLPPSDALHDALDAGDRAFEGFAWVLDPAAGLFHRFACARVPPDRAERAFRDSLSACLGAGFAPCPDCRPLAAAAAPDSDVARLVAMLEADPRRRWREADVAGLGLDPADIRKRFRRRLGIGFLQLARALAPSPRASRPEPPPDPAAAASAEVLAEIERLLDEPPPRGAAPDRAALHADWIATPIGPMLAIADAHVLHVLEFAERAALPGEIRALRAAARAVIRRGTTPAMEATRAALAAYFEGRDLSLSVPVARTGTPFRQSVWDALRRIAPGRPISYAALAEAIGNPAATRAVAQANGANPMAVVVPCHRVIGADGSLTGYGGLLWRKTWLLAHEARHAAAASETGP